MDEMQLRDQAAASKDVARVTRMFFLNLVAEGFTEAQALSLTQTWLAAQMKGAGE